MDKRRYQVVASFDTETSNCGDIASGYFAFPCLYQFAELECHITDLKPENANNVVKVSTFRDHVALYEYLDNFISKASGYIPVVLVHNLGFDMYSLAPWLNEKDVRVLAKTARKPISIQVLNDDGKPALVFLDTLGLFMKSLKVMGEECGMPKAVGDWDYSRVRTPKTPLTDEELHYAKQDTITLLCYMGYFLRQNPDISPDDIGFRVQTKTGIVRAKRLKHLGQLRGNGKTTVRQFWHLHNKDQLPKTDDELFTMHAATRGGFTFCARNNASRVYHANDVMRISSYDSTSQHPAQMASHLYPQRFSEATQEQLQIAFDTCGHVTTDRILRHWAKPLPFAFYAAFEFENLRLKAGSLFEHEGIAPLASARVGGAFPIFDNESNATFRDSMGELGYRDSAIDMHCAFGKLESASKAVLFLTELDAWVVHQCYDFDSCKAVSGYLSTTFRKPSDLSLLSVMRFYKAKDALKWFMEGYQEGKTNDATCLKGLYPDSFTKACERGDAEYSELREYYMLSKADLNSLF